jgi:hypothetical protein
MIIKLLNFAQTKPAFIPTTDWTSLHIKVTAYFFLWFPSHILLQGIWRPLLVLKLLHNEFGIGPNSENTSLQAYYFIYYENVRPES